MINPLETPTPQPVPEQYDGSRRRMHPVAKRLAAATAVGAVLLGVGCSGGGDSSPQETPRPSATAEACGPGSAPSTPAELARIAFASDRSGNFEIYAKDLASGEIKNLTKNPANDMNPQLSPDGKKLVFYRDYGEGDKRDSDIFSLELVSGKITQLTDNDASDYDPTFMPNGEILFKSNLDDGYGDVWLMGANGENPQNQTEAFPASEEWKPEALDARHFIFTSRKGDDENTDEVFVVDMTTGKAMRLTDNVVPDWYTESFGPTMAFVSNEKPNAPDGIYTMCRDGSRRTKLIGQNQIGGDSDDPSWSLDGRRVLLVNNQDGKYRAYAVNRDGSGLELLDQSPRGVDLSPIDISQSPVPVG